MGRRVSLRRVVLVSAVSVAVIVSMAGFAPAAVAKPANGTAVAHDRSVPVTAFKTSAAAVKKPPVFVPRKPVWPSAASAVVDLRVQPGGGRRGSATVGGLLVTVASVDGPAGRSGTAAADAAAAGGAPARVRVEVLDRAVAAKAHSSLAVRVSRVDGLSGGAVRVAVDYSAFRDGFGGDWANRLGLVVLADCAVSTPQAGECRSRMPLASAVDVQASVVSADVDLAAVPVADPAPGLVSPSPTDDMGGPAPVGPVDPYEGSFPVASGPTGGTDAGDTPPPSAQTAAPVSDVPGVVVALTSSPSSQTGDFSKTSLSSTGSWQHGGASGGFSWSYPVGVPPVPGGLTPDVTVGYSSASVDGLTANENSQTSWLGGGFDYQPGFIERSYMSCQDDTSPTAPYWTQTASMTDLCWRVPNARLSWNGRSTDLVPLDSSATPNTATPTVWRLADDDGTRVEYIADAGTARTGYWHNERWKLTTADGTQYWFGMTKVPGAAATTDSVLGEAIMGNHAGEPCFSSAAYTSSWCRIAYRWNLDYVVDVHGNAMAYDYTREANGQRIYGGTSTYVGYYRSAVLARIEYGLRAGSTAAAPARVVFTSSDRCWTDCATHGSNWPDVPWDLDCAAAPCPTPTFWSTKRLTAIDTQVSTGGGAYRTVDSYDVGTTAYGTATGPVVSLEYLQRTGSDSGSGINGNASVPPVIFGYGTAMQNRAWFTPGPGVAESYKFRLQEVRDETGGSVTIAYDPVDPGCTRPAPEPDPDANPYRCFRQWYSDEFNQPQWAWWNKYRVASVTEHDLIGGSPDIVHTYSYATSLAGMRTDGQSIGSSSTALWHFDGGVFSATNAVRTWSQWAGYPVVTETVGTGATVSKTTSVYFTGMDGDRTDTGDNTRSVTVLDTEADHGAANDASYRSGRRYESIVFDGASVVRKDFTGLTQVQTGSRWWSTAWGSMAPFRTYWSGASTAQARTPLSGGGWRDVQTLTTFDTDISDGVYGDVLSTSALADTSTTADDTCTAYTYNNNTATSMIRYDGGTAGPVSGLPLFDTDGYDHLFTPGDFSGDGKLDLLGVRTSDGSLWMWPGNSSGGFGAGVNINAAGWNQFDTLLSPGDFTNDGKPDIIARKTSDGTLQLYRGNGTGGLTGPQQVGIGFAQFDRLFSVGDFASNGVGDLLARQPNGDLYLYSGNGAGGWTNGNGSLINTGWDSYIPFGYRDYTGNGTADILADGPGGLWVYEGNGNGTIGTRTPLAGFGTAATASTSTGIGGYVAVGDIAGDTSKDLLVQATAHLTGTTTQTITYDNACDQPHTAADELRSTASFYDGSTAWNPRPILGDITQTMQVKDFTGTTANWITASQTSYDTYGRPTTITDPRGKSTATAYTQTNGLTSQLTVTNPLGHTVTTTLAVGRGLPVTVTDPNNKVTTGTYDALGRMLKVWRPGHTTSGTPDTEYVYTIGYDTTNKIVTSTNTAIKTMLPDGTQSTAYEILDGHGHTRQTQTPTADGKRTITDTVYDNRGLTAKTTTLYNNQSGPSPAPASVDYDTVDSSHRYTYDGAGRQLTEELWSLTTKQWNITTSTYDGERTTVDTPAGGTDTTTIADALGRTSQLWQYTAGTPGGAHTVTSYAYDHAGQLTTVTGPDGSTWSYSYDLLGRKIQTVDPDAGTSTISYDDAGRITSTHDGRGQDLSYDYDDLNRKTAEYQTLTKTAANQLAGWAYDTVASGKGQIASATRYVGGNQVGGSAYTRAVTDYDEGYRPGHIDLIIPAAEGALAGVYGTDYTYKTNGVPATQTATTKAGVAVGNLPAETLTFTYNSVGQLSGLAGAQTYLSSAAYTFDGQTAEQILGTGAAQVRHSFGYEAATRRQLTSKIETGTTGAWTNKAQDTYAYDQAGNIQYIAGTSNGVTDQVECFDYDFLRRLTDAWTEATINCTTKQRTGVDPYRQSWTYDAPNNDPLKSAGLRATETAYNTDGTTLYQSSYTYGGANKPKHSLATVATTGSGAGTKTYDYDLAGNTTNRPSPGGAQQTLTWDPEGHLAKVTDSSDTTYVYDADGVRLIRTDPGGYKTLTLTDGTELRANGSGSVAGSRYYGPFATWTANTDASGTLTSGTTLKWSITDHHGTGSIAIDPTTLQADRRRSLPYGGPRGTQASGFGTKGFVGGTTDPTGLTHLGAREYDPTTGRFISVDPLVNLADPQSWNGYAYANNAPTVSSDATGLIEITPKEPGCEYENCTHSTQGGLVVTEMLDSSGNHIHCINGKICVGPGDIKKDFDRYIETADSKLRQWSAASSAHHLSDLQLATVLDQACAAFSGKDAVCTQSFGAEMHDSAAYLVAAQNPASPANQMAMDLLVNGVPAIFAGGVGCGRIMGGPIRVTGKSFSPDTKVLMGDGSTKPISQIAPGDSVTATDPESHTTESKQVLQIHKNLDHDLAELTVDDGAADAVRVLHTTWHHRIWDATTKQWTEVQDLSAGDQLFSTPGHRVRVAGLRLGVGTAWMYDLTVDGTHTYYVLAGDTPVLVHNDGGWNPAWGPEPEWDTSYTDDDGYRTTARNDVQNKEFDDAISEAERKIGRRLTVEERRAVHDAITKQGKGYHDIVEETVDRFGGGEC